MLSTLILIILMIQECSSPHNFYLRNVLHLTVALPNIPSGYPYGQSSLHPELIIPFEFFTETFPSLMEFSHRCLCDPCIQITLALGFACITASHLPWIVPFRYQTQEVYPATLNPFHLPSKASSGCLPIWHIIYLLIFSLGVSTQEIHCNSSPEITPVD